MKHGFDYGPIQSLWHPKASNKETLFTNSILELTDDLKHEFFAKATLEKKNIIISE